MKKWMVFVLAAVCLMSTAGCGRTMDYIVANEPSVTGIVEEVHDKYILVHMETDGYPNGADCTVSLDAENKDSMTHFRVGDEVVVYYDGAIAESDPLHIGTVYAITLLTPAGREYRS